MQAVEFTTELTELTEFGLLRIPADAAAKLPAAGSARVIILTGDEGADEEWRTGAYAQFLREDPTEDAIYESLR